MKFTIGSKNSGFKHLRFKIILILISTMAFISSVDAQDVPLQRRVLEKADLRVTLSTAPTFRSEPVPLAAIRTLYVNISNTGSVAAQDFYVDVFLTQNVPSDLRQLSPQGTPSLQRRRELVKSVRAGGSTRIEIPLPNRLPKGISTGEFALVAVVDSTNKISELNENNNIAPPRRL